MAANGIYNGVCVDCARGRSRQKGPANAWCIQLCQQNRQQSSRSPGYCIGQKWQTVSLRVQKVVARRYDLHVVLVACKATLQAVTGCPEFKVDTVYERNIGKVMSASHYEVASELSRS